MLDTEKPQIQALVHGEVFTNIPEDLFIPPDALEVLLESFSGPLDLLLYLIRKQNMDILDIPIVTITKQYMQYINIMEAKKLHLAADYLVMAALLAEIKSRSLLPVMIIDGEEATEDPRMELVRRLQLYETIKIAANHLDHLPRQEREHFVIQLNTDSVEAITIHPEVSFSDLIDAMKEIIAREETLQHHQIFAEPLSVRERMTHILDMLVNKKHVLFSELFDNSEGSGGVVVSLLAILELTKQALIVITQIQLWAPIQVGGLHD